MGFLQVPGSRTKHVERQEVIAAELVSTAGACSLCFWFFLKKGNNLIQIIAAHK